MYAWIGLHRIFAGPFKSPRRAKNSLCDQIRMRVVTERTKKMEHTVRSRRPCDAISISKKRPAIVSPGAYSCVDANGSL